MAFCLIITKCVKIVIPMKLRNKAVPAVYIFLMKNEQVLIARRYNTGYQDGNYHVPAGHVEEGELPTEALIREAKEEVGIDVLPENLELVHVSYRPKHDETGDRVDFFFRCKTWKGEITNMEVDKCDELKWVSPSDLPTNITAHIRDAIECMEQGIIFKELDIDFLKKEGLYML